MSSPKLKTYFIDIQAGDVQSGNLTLSDNGETDISYAEQGDMIFWRISAGATNVGSITAITKKDGSQNLFVLGPQQIQTPNGHYWFGVANGLPGSIEDYSISWKDTNGQEHTFDPRIQMNP